MDKNIFDFEPHVQNHIIKEILINKTGYLKPCYQFKDSQSTVYDCFYAEPKNHDGWMLKDLAQLLVLLLQRKEIIPVSFLLQPSDKPRFIFDPDYERLTDEEFQQLIRFDITEAAKILEN